MLKLGLKGGGFMKQSNLDNSDKKASLILIAGIGLTIGVLFGTGII